MKRWFRVFIISVFVLAAISLLTIQLDQMRRTFSISDNMFNVAVNNAMDAAIAQIDREVIPMGNNAAPTFNYQELDSLIYDELVINGIDIHPIVGLYDGSMRSFLYSSDPTKEDNLETSPYRYAFKPVGVVSTNQFFIILSFDSTNLFPRHNTRMYSYMSMFLIFVIAVMFIISLRTMSVQRKLDNMKIEFINNMTHEIKTPISTIGLACEMLQDDSMRQDDTVNKHFIDIISTENQRMRMLVETILQSAKMSNKNFRINPTPTNINDIIGKALRSFDLSIANSGGSIETSFDPTANPIAEVDELHISNLVYNLVDNGIKYSDGVPHISVSTTFTDKDVTIRVKDQGMGISKADQHHIFEKFYRVPTGNIHNVKGFGIGLNYVAEAVRLHHGHISVESELGHGSTFIVTLPLKQPKRHRRQVK